MALKKLVHPHTGKTFKMGRKKPDLTEVIARKANYGLGSYLLDMAPVIPDEFDYTPKAAKALDRVYLNDELGCCVIAGPAHCEGVFTGNAGGEPLTFDDSEIEALYAKIGGYVPGNPDTDQGCDIQAMLAYWQSEGFKGHKIEGWIPVPTNRAKEACFLFENLIFGVPMANQWVHPFPDAGWTWDVAGPPNDDNGHCFIGAGGNTHGIKISSWGMLGTITYEAIKFYCRSNNNGELYSVITQDIIDRATQKAPNALDYAALVEDYNRLGGDLVYTA